MSQSFFWIIQVPLTDANCSFKSSRTRGSISFTLSSTILHFAHSSELILLNCQFFFWKWTPLHIFFFYHLLCVCVYMSFCLHSGDFQKFNYVELIMVFFTTFHLGDSSELNTIQWAYLKKIMRIFRYINFCLWKCLLWNDCKTIYFNRKVGFWWIS